MRMCGCLARSVPIALPAMSLPSQTDSGDQPLGARLEDVPEVHHLAHPVGHLHAHRLLAGYRREDAHLLRGQGVGEVVLQRGDLRHLDPGSEAQLVAGHMRAGDRADHARLDVEVVERLHELAALALDALGVHLLRPVRALEERRLRHPVVDLVRLGDRRAPVALGRERGLVPLRDSAARARARPAGPARVAGSGSGSGSPNPAPAARRPPPARPRRTGRDSARSRRGPAPPHGSRAPPARSPRAQAAPPTRPGSARAAPW